MKDIPNTCHMDRLLHGRDVTCIIKELRGTDRVYSIDYENGSYLFGLI